MPVRLLDEDVPGVPHAEKNPHRTPGWNRLVEEKKKGAFFFFLFLHLEFFKCKHSKQTQRQKHNLFTLSVCEDRRIKGQAIRGATLSCQSLRSRRWKSPPLLFLSDCNLRPILTPGQPNFLSPLITTTSPSPPRRRGQGRQRVGCRPTPPTGPPCGVPPTNVNLTSGFSQRPPRRAVGPQRALWERWRKCPTGRPGGQPTVPSITNECGDRAAPGASPPPRKPEPPGPSSAKQTRSLPPAPTPPCLQTRLIGDLIYSGTCGFIYLEISR